MTKRLTPQEKKNRKPASRACIFCHTKHLQCSNERPCKNCVKRSIGDQCRDIERKRAKYLRDGGAGSQKSGLKRARSSLSQEAAESATDSDAIPTDFPDLNSASNSPTALQKTTEIPTRGKNMLDTTNEVLSKLFAADLAHQGSQDMLIDNKFDSSYLNQEYRMLGDIILQAKPTSPSQSSNSYISPAQVLTEDRYKDTRPFISLGFPTNDDESFHEETNSINDVQNNIAMQFKPPEEGQRVATVSYVSPLECHQVYKSVRDIYSHQIIDFDYPQSYHSLTHFLKKRFSGNDLSVEERQRKRQNLLIILKLIASYRPTFISAHKSLYKPWDLQFLEMTFQRSLIDYEKLSILNSSPTIIWRRTGEIVSISNDLVSLLGLNSNDVLSTRTFIMELMYDDESIVQYFRLFKSVAVGNLHSSIITKCKLIRNNADVDYIEFCSVWTVKRDIFDIPMLIIGQFLPILSPSDGFRIY